MKSHKILCPCLITIYPDGSKEERDMVVAEISLPEDSGELTMISDGCVATLNSISNYVCEAPSILYLGSRVEFHILDSNLARIFWK